MKVICLIGEAKTGKTKTMNLILKDILKVDIKKPKIQKDFCMSFLHNGRLLGICSSGDTLKILNDNLTLLKERGCETIICACHPTKKHKEFIRKIGGEVKEIPCNKPEPQTEENWRIEHLDRLEQVKGYLR